MWRQGDIFMAAVDKIPEQAEKLDHGVLAEGEITGHAHRIADVPPFIKSCRQAIAWTAGFDDAELYRPLVET